MALLIVVIHGGTGGLLVVLSAVYGVANKVSGAVDDDTAHIQNCICVFCTVLYILTCGKPSYCMCISAANVMLIRNVQHIHAMLAKLEMLLTSLLSVWAVSLVI